MGGRRWVFKSVSKLGSRLEKPCVYRPRKSLALSKGGALTLKSMELKVEITLGVCSSFYCKTNPESWEKKE